MALTREQRQVASTALSEADRILGDHPYAARIKKSLLEAGLVESNLRNVNYGDRDSLGFLQQRPSQGWGSPAQVRDVRHATRSFVTRAMRVAGQYKTAGRLAQGVQRSAFPDRYDARGKDAQSILRGLGGSTGSGGSSGSGDGTTVRTGGTAPVADPMDSALTTLLLGQLQQEKPQIQSQGLQAPSFTARPVLSQAGAQASGSGQVVKPKASLADQLAIVRGLQGSEAPKPEGATTQTVTSETGGSSGSRTGKVTVRSGADRAGAKTNPKVLSFAEKVAGIYGSPLTVGTGTNHNRLTVNGNVSDHWAGNAVDIPLAGKALTRAGHAALIAAGMDPKKARQAKGGIYNVGGHQIIFNTTQGGNHWNHLHVSAR